MNLTVAGLTHWYDWKRGRLRLFSTTPPTGFAVRSPRQMATHPDPQTSPSLQRKESNGDVGSGLWVFMVYKRSATSTAPKMGLRLNGSIKGRAVHWTNRSAVTSRQNGGPLTAMATISVRIVNKRSADRRSLRMRGDMSA
jgi:hypothetical protein